MIVVVARENEVDMTALTVRELASIPNFFRTSDERSTQPKLHRLQQSPSHPPPVLHIVHNVQGVCDSP